MSLFTPPVKDDMNKRKVQHEAESMFIDMLGEAMLNSDMPEEKKIGVRVLLEMKKVKDKLADKLEVLCDPEQAETEELYAKRKEALELLQKIHTEVEGFDPTVAPPRTAVNQSYSESKKNRIKGEKLCIRISLPKF